MKNLRDFTHDELTEVASGMGEPRFRADQLYRWVFHRGAREVGAMTDLSKAFRERLAREGYGVADLEVEKVSRSADGTAKLLLSLHDGCRVESVIIPEGGRTTLCVSSQAGCGLGCEFCMTGRGGLERNLTLAELTGQVFAAGDELTGGPPEAGEAPEGTAGSGHRGITNIVLMGMGEPLANFDNVVRFLDVLTDPRGMGFSHNRVTLSTVGLVPEIRELGRVSKANLAVSLNATTDEVRSRLMPVNRKYPLTELMAALREYPLSGKKRITLEYVMIDGVNDTDADAGRLVELARSVRSKVNLIPFNPFAGSGYRRSPDAAIDRFRAMLVERGVMAIRRRTRGGDIDAACGQLAGQVEDRSRRARRFAEPRFGEAAT